LLVSAPAEGYTPVRIDAVLAFAEAVLLKHDVPEEDARLTARILLDADLRGIESHGLAHLVDFYVRRLQQGEITPRPNLRVTSEAASAATIDGDRGLGFVVGHRAMELAIEKARATGAGFVTAGNSTHYGAGAYNAMMALERDMVGLSMTTGGRLMAPPGGRGRAIGLNVFAVAAPTSQGFPYVLDMATSVVAAGKFEIARRRGLPVPEGWAVDAEGLPITDPHHLHPHGALLPLGGTPLGGAFKGFGLTLLVDILSGALSGFGTSVEIDPGITAAHCFGALRIDAFEPLPEFLEHMGRTVDTLKATPMPPGAPEVRIPGELEHALSEQRRAAGAVPLHPAILEGFRTAAAELNVPFDLL
jgi:LDH2 family malate/lactate/ureidoglycolate dehydrogenase